MDDELVLQYMELYGVDEETAISRLGEIDGPGPGYYNPDAHWVGDDGLSDGLESEI